MPDEPFLQNLGTRGSTRNSLVLAVRQTAIFENLLVLPKVDDRRRDSCATRIGVVQRVVPHIYAKLARAVSLPPLHSQERFSRNRSEFRNMWYIRNKKQDALGIQRKYRVTYHEESI